MFVLVNFGDGQKLLCNTECRGSHFMDHVRSKCNVPESAEIVFADLKGNVKAVEDSQDEYADDYLTKEREELILVLVHRESFYDDNSKSFQETVTFVPASTNDELITAKFKARLKIQNNQYWANDSTRSYSNMIAKQQVQKRRGTL